MTKRQQLQQILDNLKAGRIPDKELRSLKIVNAEGATVSLASPDAIAVVEARLAALPAEG